MRWFWQRKEPESEPTPSSIMDIAMDGVERENLYRLMHHLDGIELHRRVAEPLDRAREVTEIMLHFSDRGISLPWNVNELKDMIVAYEMKNGAAA